MKRIVHIMPHFAPGHCGVSDYSVCWSAWMDGSAEVYRAALADKYHPGILEQDRLLRMGAEQPLAERLNRLQNWLHGHKFDEAIFHYVPHGYQANGLPWWVWRLPPLLAKHNLRVTFLAHEIWMGGPGKPLLTRVKGFLQKLLFKRLAGLLEHPNIITTSAFTARQLQHEGLLAEWCPVFSNLGTEVSAESLPQEVADLLRAGRHTAICMFGSIPPDTPIEDFTGFLNLLWKQYQKPILLVHAGHAHTRPLQDIEAACKGWLNLETAELGPLPAPTLNALMQQCHWGVSTYPLQLWSKSGSIAAMLANGLPVGVLGSLPQEPLPLRESLPEGLLPWALLTAVERATWVNHFQRPRPKQDDYNRLVYSRLFALSGLGRQVTEPLPGLQRTLNY